MARKSEGTGRRKETEKKKKKEKRISAQQSIPYRECAYSILTSSKASFWGMIFITDSYSSMLLLRLMKDNWKWMALSK